MRSRGAFAGDRGGRQRPSSAARRRCLARRPDRAPRPVRLSLRRAVRDGCGAQACSGHRSRPPDAIEAKPMRISTWWRLRRSPTWWRWSARIARSCVAACTRSPLAKAWLARADVGSPRGAEQAQRARRGLWACASHQCGGTPLPSRRSARADPHRGSLCALLKSRRSSTAQTASAGTPSSAIRIQAEAQIAQIEEPDGRSAYVLAGEGWHRRRDRDRRLASGRAPSPTGGTHRTRRREWRAGRGAASRGMTCSGG